MTRENLCWNSSTRSPTTTIIAPQCFANTITRKVTVNYSDEPTDQDVLYLCLPCALQIRTDARKHGYSVTVEKLDTQEGGTA